MRQYRAWLALGVLAIFLFAGIATTKNVLVPKWSSTSISGGTVASFSFQERKNTTTVSIDAQNHDRAFPISNDQWLDCSHTDSICRWLSPPTQIQLIDDSRLCNNLAYPRYHTVSWKNEGCNIKQLSSRTKSITYFKVLKAGSTTMTHALQTFERRIRGTDCQVSVQTRPLRDPSGRVSQAHLESIAKDQRADSQSHAMLTIIRDPVERFLSALGQALLMKDTAKHLHEDCDKYVTSDNKLGLVECAVHLLESTTRSYSEVETHLCPQAAMLHTKVDLRIAAIDMSNFSSLLQHLVPGYSAHHARDRSVVTYSHSQMLSSLKAKDLSRDLIDRICRLYQVDVKLRRDIEMPNKWCDK
jgi:hypothetical protein